MKRCCFCSNPEEIVTPKEKRNIKSLKCNTKTLITKYSSSEFFNKYLECFTYNDSTVILSIRCDGNFYVQEAESTESVIICIHGTKLPSGEETTSSADRSDRSVEGGSGVLIHPGSSQRKS
ncbi:hypothetical protein T4C_1201 [Trichinella pseudospiralis]|uniref:Uncharacterized protein n=1 Tax=Trichinella pseudospiralis TaxID=6337 RepID=A0A0V1JXT2_TRIPS|nr:hypothetical protein T4C_1201 [Trichinella pseudospiralis]